MKHKQQTNLLYKDLVISNIIVGIRSKIFFIIVFAFSMVITYHNFNSYDCVQMCDFMTIDYVYLGLDFIKNFLSIFLAIALFQSFVFIFIPQKGVVGTHDFYFYDDEFIESTEYNKSHHKYTSIPWVFSSFGYIYIQIHGGMFHILPKRDFDNIKDYDTLLTFLKNKIEFKKSNK